jgi:DNA-binding transcriptional MerR regulator
MRIGHLAKRVGATVEALRFYEKLGLLGPVRRDRSGYRIYDEQAYRALIVVRWAQSAGLTLREMALFMGGRGPSRVSALHALIDAKLDDIRASQERLRRQIARLQALRAMSWDGTCTLPKAFVDELVGAESQLGTSGASRSADSSVARASRKR